MLVSPCLWRLCLRCRARPAPTVESERVVRGAFGSWDRRPIQARVNEAPQRGHTRMGSRMHLNSWPCPGWGDSGALKMLGWELIGFHCSRVVGNRNLHVWYLCTIAISRQANLYRAEQVVARSSAASQGGRVFDAICRCRSGEETGTEKCHHASGQEAPCDHYRLRVVVCFFMTCRMAILCAT